MAWELTSWLVLVRSLQLVASTITCGLNGYVLARFTRAISRSALPSDFIVLEGFVCALCPATFKFSLLV